VGPLVVSVYLGIHFSWSNQRRQDAVFILLAGLLGIGVEVFYKTSGLIVYQADVPGWMGVPPVWIMALWFLFVSTLTASLGWLRGRYFLSSALGAVFGPLSYLAGEGLGALALPHPLLLSVGAFALSWALILPVLAWMADSLLPAKQRTEL
jgi:hypothetical protein